MHKLQSIKILFLLLLTHAGITQAQWMRQVDTPGYVNCSCRQRQ